MADEILWKLGSPLRDFYILASKLSPNELIDIYNPSKVTLLVNFPIKEHNKETIPNEENEEIEDIYIETDDKVLPTTEQKNEEDNESKSYYNITEIDQSINSKVDRTYLNAVYGLTNNLDCTRMYLCSGRSSNGIKVLPKFKLCNIEPLELEDNNTVTNIIDSINQLIRIKQYNRYHYNEWDIKLHNVNDILRTVHRISITNDDYNELRFLPFPKEEFILILSNSYNEEIVPCLMISKDKILLFGIYMGFDIDDGFLIRTSDKIKFPNIESTYSYYHPLSKIINKTFKEYNKIYPIKKDERYNILGFINYYVNTLLEYIIN
jgi:hypothetical protein